MKPSVLRGVEEDKEVMEDASINRPPVVGFMQDKTLLRVRIVLSAACYSGKNRPDFFFSVSDKAQDLIGILDC